MARKRRIIEEAFGGILYSENNSGLHSAYNISTQKYEKTYKTAIYARLSIEDLGRNDSGTIENQILLVQKYIESKPYLRLHNTFIDNGQTGMNFERDGFKKLMENIKLGNIDCIVVKDLSRFGRNYVETGSYLENLFPFLGVRFISVNDNYDSHNQIKKNDNLSVILKNLINDIYAKDISNKSKTAIETLQRKGKHTGSHAPYGYIKSLTDRHKFVIDEYAASIVRDVFQWKLDGVPTIAIARKLNDTGIPSPGNYGYMKGLYTNSRFAKKIFWTDHYIRTMLMNPVYIGHMVQGKNKSEIPRGEQKIQPKENWIIIENTHEPIIDVALFETVQNIIAENKVEHFKTRGINTDVERAENIFAGIIYCIDCGKGLRRKQYKMPSKSKKLNYYFKCPSYSFSSTEKCLRKHLTENDLKDLIFNSIKQRIALLVDMENKIKNINSSRKAKSREFELQTEIKSKEQRLFRLDSLKNSIYDDFQDGLLNESEYKYIRQNYENEHNLIISRLSEISTELENITDKFIENNKCISETCNFKDIDILTREMLTALVNKIMIHNNNRIEIFYKYKDEFEQLQRYIEENGVNI